MTLRIITGTIEHATDPFGILQKIKSEGWFTRWHWYGGTDWRYTNCKVLADDGKHFSFIQTTGSGKTVYSTYLSFVAHTKGIKTGANYSIRWTDRNIKKKKEEWVPEIQSMEEFEACKMMHITIDDIVGTSDYWNSKEARMVSSLSRLSRKMGNYVDVTTQALENMVPTSMRRITDEYIVPYIHAVNELERGPDGRAIPLEILLMKFSPGFALIGYETKVFYTKFGRWLMDSFDTLELAGTMRTGIDRPRTDQPGYKLEVKAFEYLKEQCPSMKWQHLNGKHVFDIVSDTHAIDIVGTDQDNALILDHKNLLKHINTAKNKGQVAYIMFEFRNEWRFIKITYNLNDLVEGKRIKAANLQYRSKTLESIVG